MRRTNYVCTTHHIAHRAEDFWGLGGATQVGSKHCPVDGAPMASIGYKWRIPRKTDDRGWAQLTKMIQKARRRNALHEYHRATGIGWWERAKAERLLELWKGRA